MIGSQVMKEFVKIRNQFLRVESHDDYCPSTHDDPSIYNTMCTKCVHSDLYNPLTRIKILQNLAGSHCLSFFKKSKLKRYSCLVFVVIKG